MSKEREDFAARFNDLLHEDPRFRALEQSLETQRHAAEAATARIHALADREIKVLAERPPPPPTALPADPPVSRSGWTLEAFMEHFQVIRTADHRFYEERFNSQQRFHAERDRRLTEVAVEREKALKIKETADLAALQLAREIQTYKDEKANELREQIGSERGLYATKNDIAVVDDKLDEYAKTEQEKREIALLRVNEKFEGALARNDERQEEFMTRVEARQREFEQKLSIMEGASEQAQRAVEDEARVTQAKQAELSRRTNRNMAILGVAVAVVVAIANGLGPF